MALYLAAETLSEAIARLGESLATGAVTDFLIFKRALVLGAHSKPPLDYVETGLDSKIFQAAIFEFAAPHSSWAGPPFFSPFGWKRDRQSGFKSPKYPSNGPSDTVAGWQSRGTTPFALVPNSKPKRYTHVDRDASELRNFFLKKSGGEPPLILDIARWWYRSDDLEARFGHGPVAKELCDAFVTDFGLSANEVTGLFDQLPAAQEKTPAGKFVAAAAEPQSYLPTAIASAPKVSIASIATAPKDFEARVESVWKYVEAKGFVFEPWHVAAYITAVRTKPFVILAGISGTGKTKLPRLVAEATGSEIEVIPVHPDWTDGSELIGYERLDGKFIPGRLLQLARKAQENPAKQYFALLDEMNIARVEYYLADILSHIEEREMGADGPKSKPLAPYASDPAWTEICLPPNLCIAGSVNMDETTHGFSRKVLDRSFVIEFSDIDLTRIGEAGTPIPASQWVARDWQQEYLTLAAHPDKRSPLVEDVIGALDTINDALQSAQLHVGYRVRDEVALFRLNARQCEGLFRTADAGQIDPLDLAVTMKILPRVQGGASAIKDALDQMSAWAKPPSAAGDQSKAFPLCEQRLALMRGRLRSGFTSYWL